MDEDHRPAEESEVARTVEGGLAVNRRGRGLQRVPAEPAARRPPREGRAHRRCTLRRAGLARGNSRGAENEHDNHLQLEFFNKLLELDERCGGFRIRSAGQNPGRLAPKS